MIPTPRDAGAMLAPIRPDRLERPVFAVFEAAVAIDPQAVAVFGGTTAGEAATRYGELHLMACRIAAAIDAASPSGVPVAVALPASAGCLAALLAALAVGRPCVPLDPSFPADRNRMIMDHAGVGLLVTDRASRDRSPALADLALAAGAAVILIDDLPRLPPSDWRPTGRADDIAWVIYTSGSTGSPKGVCQTQRGLLHDIFQYLDVTGIGPGDRLTQLYSPSVGGALRDMYGAVLSGAALVPVDLRAEGIAGVARRFQAARPTVFHAMPTVLRALTDSGAGPAALGGARLAYLAGERIFADDLARVFASAPDDLLIYVGIGSTENATIYRHWLIDRATAAGLDGGLVPVGWPVADRRMRLIDAAGQPVADGEVGEIEVESAFMAAGYWRDPALSAAIFQTGGDVAPGARRLRTGDLGRLRADGLLDFIGRADSQVKIRGYRVEPAEVEAVLRALPGVGDAAVLPDQAPSGEAALAAVVVPMAGGFLDPLALRNRLIDTQPGHLLPRRLLVAADLPRLANFKLDMAAMSAWLAAVPAGLSRMEAPAQPDDHHPVSSRHVADDADALPAMVVTAINTAWRDLFGAHAPLSGASFAELGGSSLDLLRFAVRVETMSGMAIPPALWTGAITPQMLCSALASQPAVGSSLHRKVMVLLPGAPGMSENLLLLAARFSRDMPVHLLSFPDLEDELAHNRSIDDLGRMVAEHITERLSKMQTTGTAVPSYGICGISFGGRVAASAAAHLAARGLPPDLVVIGDIAARIDDPALVSGALRPSPPAVGGRAWVRRRGGNALAAMAFRLSRRPDRRWLRLMVAVTRRLLPSRALRQRLEPRILTAMRRAMIINWQPPRLPCPVVLLVAEATCADYPGGDRRLGWDAATDDLRIVSLSGDHSRLLATDQRRGEIARAIADAWPVVS